jgi:hypothetical protein
MLPRRCEFYSSIFFLIHFFFPVLHKSLSVLLYLSLAHALLLPPALIFLVDCIILYPPTVLDPTGWEEHKYAYWSHFGHLPRQVSFLLLCIARSDQSIHSCHHHVPSPRAMTTCHHHARLRSIAISYPLAFPATAAWPHPLLMLQPRSEWRVASSLHRYLSLTTFFLLLALTLLFDIF